MCQNNCHFGHYFRYYYSTELAKSHTNRCRLHITITGGLSRCIMLQTLPFQHITVWRKCIARLIKVDFAWKKSVHDVIAKRCQSCGTWRRRVHYQHWCGRSPTMLLWDKLSVKSTFQALNIQRHLSRLVAATVCPDLATGPFHRCHTRWSFS